MIFSALIAFIPAIAIGRESGYAVFILWLLFTLGLVKLVKYMLNHGRTQKQFSIDGSEFEVDGQHYAREHITSLYMQEGNSAPLADLNMQSSQAIIAFRANPAGLLAASAMNAAQGTGRVADAAADKLRKNMSYHPCSAL